MIDRKRGVVIRMGELDVVNKGKGGLVKGEERGDKNRRWK
jgi:hypothetical protein